MALVCFYDIMLEIALIGYPGIQRALQINSMKQCWLPSLPQIIPPLCSSPSFLSPALHSEKHNSFVSTVHIVNVILHP